MTIPLKKILLGALVVPALALAAACGSGSDSSDMARRAADNSGSASGVKAGDSPGIDGLAPQPAAPEEASLTTLSGDYDSVARDAEDKPADEPKTQTNAQTQAVISKGQISLRSKDIDGTRFELQKLLDTLNGTIADEQSNADKKGRTIRQRLVLRVPSPQFDDAMDGISKLGTLIGRSRTSTDVTTEVIDNNTRVRTQRASLERIRALLAEATSLREVISIEGELSRRQSDLDSLEQQQKYLADQTSLSTISVYLTVPDKKGTAHKDDDNNTFWSGLKSGWDALGDGTNAVLTAVGAVLPFAAVLGLIGFPAWAAWRRRTPKTAPVA